MNSTKFARRMVACSTTAPRPRVFTYPVAELLDQKLVPPPAQWRLGIGLNEWVAASPYHEPDGSCADFFLVPSYPSNVDSLQSMKPHGDWRVARLFHYLRMRWPHWNRSVALGEPRHVSPTSTTQHLLQRRARRPPRATRASPSCKRSRSA